MFVNSVGCGRVRGWCWKNIFKVLISLRKALRTLKISMEVQDCLEISLNLLIWLPMGMAVRGFILRYYLVWHIGEGKSQTYNCIFKFCIGAGTWVASGAVINVVKCMFKWMSHGPTAARLVWRGMHHVMYVASLTLIMSVGCGSSHRLPDQFYLTMQSGQFFPEADTRDNTSHHTGASATHNKHGTPTHVGVAVATTFSQVFNTRSVHHERRLTNSVGVPKS